MKDRRGFLKLLGIGAGAAAAGVLAMVAGTPTPAPRTIQDIEKIKPYIGPDGLPGSDYIKERPQVVPGEVIAPKLTPDEYHWVLSNIDWTPAHELLVPVEPIYSTADPDPTLEVVTTTGTYPQTTADIYNHTLGGYVDYEG